MYFHRLVNTCSSSGGEYPLHVAVENEALKVISALVAAGAELDVIDIRGNTPLHIAASKCVPIIQVRYFGVVNKIFFKSIMM